MGHRKNRISDKPGIRKLLYSHSFLLSGRTLFDIFLNVFIWKYTQDIALVALFNITLLAFHVLGFTLFSKIAKKGLVRIPRKIGLLGLSASYFIIFLLGNYSIDYILPIGALIGIFNGAYWLSYHITRFDITSKKNRGNFTGIEGSLKMLIEIVIPAAGGFIIAASPFGMGYQIAFLIGSAFFISSAIFGNVEYDVKGTSSFDIKRILKISVKDRDLRKYLFVHIMTGLGRAGPLRNIIISLFIFSVLNNEFDLGLWLSLFSLVSIIASFLIGRYLDYRNYRSLLIASGFLFAMLMFSAAVHPVFITYALLGLGHKFLFSAIRIPKRVIGDNIIHKIDDYENNRVEFIVLREWFDIVLGRITSYSIILFAGGLLTSNMQIGLIIMGIAILAEAVILSTIRNGLKAD